MKLYIDLTEDQARALRDTFVKAATTPPGEGPEDDEAPPLVTGPLYVGRRLRRPAYDATSPDARPVMFVHCRVARVTREGRVCLQDTSYPHVCVWYSEDYVRHNARPDAI
jgi:hypothetical protein